MGTASRIQQETQWTQPSKQLLLPISISHSSQVISSRHVTTLRLVPLPTGHNFSRTHGSRTPMETGSTPQMAPINVQLSENVVMLLATCTNAFTSSAVASKSQLIHVSHGVTNLDTSRNQKKPDLCHKRTS